MDLSHTMQYIVKGILFRNFMFSLLQFTLARPQDKGSDVETVFKGAISISILNI